MFHYGLKTALPRSSPPPHNAAAAHVIPQQTALHSAHQLTSSHALQVPNVPLRSKDRHSTFITIHPQCRSTHSIPQQTTLHSAHQPTSSPTLQVMNVPLRTQDRHSTFITTPTMPQHSLHPPTSHPSHHPYNSISTLHSAHQLTSSQPFR